MAGLQKRFVEQFKAKPIATTSALVGIVVGIITIITFSSTVYDKAEETIDTHFVSPDELSVSEAKIIDRIENLEKAIVQRIDAESEQIRLVLVTEIIARKASLTKLLIAAKTKGEVEVYKLEIESLTAKIDKLIKHQPVPIQ